MRVRIVPRAARGAALVAAVTTAAAGCLAGSAMAATSTISVANATTTPEQAVPVDLSFSGTNGSTGNATVDAVVRPAGGLGCQNSYQEDVTTLGGEDTTILAPAAQALPAGAYQVAANYKPPAPGSYQVCAWLDGSQDGTDSLAAPASINFTAQGPQVSELSISVPKALTPNVSFKLGYTTQTDQQLNLYSVLLPAGTTSAGTTSAGTTSAETCADSFELQQQEQDPAETILLGAGAASVFGGPTSTTAIVKQRTGLYTVCAWLEGPNTQEVDKAVSTPITVGTPVAPAPPPPALKLTAVKASKRDGVSVSGSTAARFTGRLLVSAACGSSTAKRTATVKRHHFSSAFGLPRGCRIGRKVKVSVSWAGSGSWSKQSASRSVAVRR